MGYGANTGAKDMSLNTTSMAASGIRRDILVDTAARGDTVATVSIASISEQDLVHFEDAWRLSHSGVRQGAAIRAADDHRAR
jgi:hypothetical protein